MSTLLRLNNIRWLDPFLDIDRTGDLLIEQGRLRAADERQTDPVDQIDGTGLWLMPGMIDLGHSLLPDKTIEGADAASELQAAWHCGLATVCAWPDAATMTDRSATVDRLLRQAEANAGSALKLLGALTPGLAGVQLSNMAALKNAGCVGLSQGHTVLPAFDILRQAMRYASDLDLTLHLSPRIRELDQGCAHDGATAAALGLSGIPAANESVAMASLIALAADTGCRLHLGPLSSAAAAEQLRQARARGLPISADVAIWNLLFDESALQGYNSAFHLQPPVRSEADREQLLRLVADGEIQAICSHHQPHNADAKFGPFAETRPGANGIDGFIALLLRLFSNGRLSALNLAQRTSAGPAEILGINADEARRHWLLVDPAHVWRLQHDSFASHARNSPMIDSELTGAVAGWLTDGDIQLYRNWQQRLGV